MKNYNSLIKYSFISIFAFLIVLFSYISIKSSYGGINLSFLEKRLNQIINSESKLNLEFENFLLKRNNDIGFYIHFDKLKINSNKKIMLNL